VSYRLSYLLTAAGQFRTLTGFPFSSSCGGTEEWEPLYLGYECNATLRIVDIRGMIVATSEGLAFRRHGGGACIWIGLFHGRFDNGPA
jgi:hypothetical protein